MKQAAQTIGVTDFEDRRANVVNVIAITVTSALRYVTSNFNNRPAPTITPACTQVRHHQKHDYKAHNK